MLAAKIQERAPERQCALTRARAPKETLLRLSLDPDGKPFVDLLARAPGRGVYVQSSALSRALEPKGLKAVFKGKARPLNQEEIEATVKGTARRIEDRIVELIGLARRAGALEIGIDAVLRSLEGGIAAIAVVACDASDRTVRKVEEALGPAALVRASTKESLGHLFGRDEVGVVAVHPSKLADRISAESVRLAGLSDVLSSARRAEG